MDETLRDNILRISNPREFYGGLDVPTIQLPERVLLFYRNDRMDSYYRSCHHRHVLIVNLETVGSVILDDLVLRLQPDHALLIFPHQFHHYANMPLAHCLWLFVTFELQPTDDLAGLRNTPVRLTQMARHHVSELVEVYLAVLKKPDTGQRLPLLLRLLLHELIQSTGDKRVVRRKRAQAGVGSGSRLIQQVSALLLRRLEDPLGIVDVARELAMSESHLRNTFKAAAGMSLGVFMRRFRIHKACGMLAASSATVSEIAARCGFDSLYAFSRAFRREMGFPPTDYRKRHGRGA